jgi:hypothetical protein
MRAHVEVGHDGAMRHQAHLGLAGCAGGHIQDGVIGIVEFGANAFEGGRVGSENALAFRADAVQRVVARAGAGGRSGE